MGREQTDREARLKAALRDNLRKRKARDREVEDRGAEGGAEADER